MLKFKNKNILKITRCFFAGTSLLHLRSYSGTGRGSNSSLVSKLCKQYHLCSESVSQSAGTDHCCLYIMALEFVYIFRVFQETLQYILLLKKFILMDLLALNVIERWNTMVEYYGTCNNYSRGHWCPSEYRFRLCRIVVVSHKIEY